MLQEAENVKEFCGVCLNDIPDGSEECRHCAAARPSSFIPDSAIVLGLTLVLILWITTGLRL